MNGTEVSSSAVPASQSRLVDVVISTTMPLLSVAVKKRRIWRWRWCLSGIRAPLIMPDKHPELLIRLLMMDFFLRGRFVGSFPPFCPLSLHTQHSTLNTQHPSSVSVISHQSSVSIISIDASDHSSVHILAGREVNIIYYHCYTSHSLKMTTLKINYLKYISLESIQNNMEVMISLSDSTFWCFLYPDIFQRLF